MRRASNPEPSSESLATKIVTKTIKAVASAKLPTEGNSGFFDELSFERCTKKRITKITSKGEGH